MERFTWEDAEYPCLGISVDGEIVCFSEYGKGHTVARGNENFYSALWKMKNFAPYVKPKEKEKLWYWEFKDDEGDWGLTNVRFSEEEVKTFKVNTYRKLEALGFIYEEN